MEHRGQSALEYLMTYGWALVVIVIAVAALVVLINPSQLQGNHCDAKIGPFSLSPETSVANDRMSLVLTNTLGVALSDSDFDISNKGTTLHSVAAGTGSGCRDLTLNPNATSSWTCVFGSSIGAGNAYDITLKLTYATPNVTGAARPTVSAKCTGTIPA